MRVDRLWLCIAILTASGWAIAAPVIYVGTDASALERFAASELQRYCYAVDGKLLAIENAMGVQSSATGFVLGTPGTLPRVGEDWPFGLDEPAAEGYVLHTISDGGRKLIVVAAPTPAGVQNGVYGLLERFGFGFYLGGDTLPAKLPSIAGAVSEGIHLSQSPAFSVRGSLPWYNFFNSPTAWELADHKAFIDQLAKMRCNFVGFHAYDTEPFAAYEFGDALVGGEPLVNTSKPTWGTRPMATGDFLAGTGQFFARDYFGAASSHMDNRVQSIAAAKDVLRQSLRYAKDRGMQVCLGFELRGDPFDPDTQSRFEARLKSLLQDYPMLDYVWLWEPEAMAVSPGGEPAARTPWHTATERWSEAFADVPEADRRAEAVRLSLFAWQARRVMEAVRPDVDLVLSGWGGDQWLHYSDFFPGMDQILPEDVVFSALDNIRVTPTVSDAYGAVSKDRPRWPILWFEFDGDQWMPQPNLRETAGACRDALDKGCQGLLGIHWRTRAVEEAAAFCAQFAWDTELTVEAFCERRARDLFADDAEEMAPYLLRLQDLGYRWAGGGGQAECASFSWGAGEPAKRAELATIAYELRQRAGQSSSLVEGLFQEIGTIGSGLTGVIEWGLGGDSGGEAPPPPHTPLEDLIAQIEYVLLYDHAAALLQPGGGLDELVSEGEHEQALELIRASKLSQAFLTYARRIRNKGELGVLATMNAKAWADIQRRAGLDEQTLQDLTQLPEAYRKSPVLLVLPDRAIVAGVPEARQERVKAVLKARLLGERRFYEMPLEPIGNTTFALRFPEEVLAGGPFEYGVEITGLRRLSLSWPKGFPTTTATANILIPGERRLGRALVAASVTPVDVRAQIDPDRWRVQLQWDARPAEVYAVSRNGEPLATVSDGWCIDATPPSGADVTYRVEARNVASGEKAAAQILVSIPELPLPAPPASIDTTSRANRVILGWQSDAPNAAQYCIAKYGDRHEVVKRIYVDADFGHYLETSDEVIPGEAYTYAIAAVASDGRVGPPSRRVGIIASTEPLKPKLQLSFDDDAFLAGLAQLSERGLALGGRGWAELAAQSKWDPTHALTLGVWVRMDDLEGMPVLICKGSWQQAGYFLQILNRRVRFYLAGVDTLDAGNPPAGQWVHIVATYGSGEMRIYLDGELAGRKYVTGRPKPSAAPLLIGRYGITDDAYFVRGLLDDVRIYDVSLTPGEIEDLYTQTMRQ
ncbi:MAG: hypothetical protein GWP08_02975 [Nitrospiraceae bacterium]|nr:hypothetical protein [Nitrospiraceae bacterium]